MRTVYYEPRSRHPGLHYYRGTPLSLLREALSRAGCELSLVSSHAADRNETDAGLESLHQAEDALAEQLLATWGSDAVGRPDLWVTGGLCPHSLDRVGPRVSRELGIPYVLVEPQIGEGTSELATPDDKQAAKDAVRRAAIILTTRSHTARALSTLLDEPDRVTHLLPFLDLASARSAGQLRDTYRHVLANRVRLSSNCLRLVTDGPQQSGPSFEAWQMLALALSRIVLMDWGIVVLGHGGATREVRETMLRLPRQRVCYWPDATPADRMLALAGSDLYVWPATDGGGLPSLLEAQATGTPVVACQSPDVADRVMDGQTGRLSAANAESLANGISFLLRHEGFRETYGKQAREIANSQHDLRPAAMALKGILSTAVLGTRG